MQDELSKEYLLLFHAITATMDSLEHIKLSLLLAQQEAERIYLERTE